MEHIVQGFFYAISVIVELYGNSNLPSLLHSFFTKSEGIYSSYLTDTITLFAALSAIAIPIAQQTLQWASDKYQSPSLVTFIDFTARIKPRDMNKKLLFYICVVIVFKVMTGFVELNETLFLLLLICIMLRFFYLVYYVIQHLEHTYKIVQGLEWVKGAIGANFIDSHLKNKDEHFSLKIKVLSEYESYQLRNDPQYVELSENYTSIGYKLTKDVNKALDNDTVTQFLSGLDYICLSLIDNKNFDKYKKVASYYSYIVSKCIKSSENQIYNGWLSSLYYLASTVEVNYKNKYKPISSGRVFMDLGWFGKWNKEAQNSLIEHFRNLISLNLNNNDVDNIDNLLQSVDSVISFYEPQQRFEWYIQNEIPDLYRSEPADKFRKLIISNIEKQDGVEAIIDVIPSTKQLIITEFQDDSNMISALEKAFEELEDKLWLFRFKTLLDAEVLNLIASSIKLDPNIIIRYRSKNNSIDADSVTLNSTFIPSSLEDVLLSYLTQERFTSWNRMTNWSQYLSKGLSILFIYEIIRSYKAGNIVSDYSFINKLSINKLESSFDLLVKFKQIIPNTILLPVIQDLLILHSCMTSDIETASISYIDGLEKRTSELLKSKLTTSTLDSLTLDRFKSSFYEKAKELLSASELLKRVTISLSTQVNYNFCMPRRSLLANTGVYYDFSGYASRIIGDHLNRLKTNILSNTNKALNANICTPIPNGRLVILSRTSLNILVQQGFSVKQKVLYWPNNIFSCPIEVANTNNDDFYLVYKNESLVRLSFYNTNMGNLPINLNFQDRQGEIKWKVGVNIAHIIESKSEKKTK